MTKTATVILAVITLLASASGCLQRQSKQNTAVPKTNVEKSSYKTNIQGMVDIYTSDQYTRSIAKGFGFYADEETVVANLNLIQGAARAKIAVPGTQQLYDITGYTAYSNSLNLVLLKTARRNKNFLKLSEPSAQPDTLYTLLRPSRDLFVSKCRVSSEIKNDSAAFYRLSCVLEPGKPAFYPDHSTAGIVQKHEKEDGTAETVVLHGQFVINLLSQQKEQKPILDLKDKSNKTYLPYTKVKGIRVNTSEGTFIIRLYNETAAYRDNFIRLVSDSYYDSLLIHRVLKNFLIQTGASDTRNAQQGESVGWQGPGYTLPLNIVPHLYHKRGAVAASKLPDERNPHNRSDGSQFYIVNGRRFAASELDEIEKTKNIEFTDTQRQVYATIGGAPHLDGDYTVFGEVETGMDVVDRIAAVETDLADRPVKDIRIINVTIIEK